MKRKIATVVGAGMQGCLVALQLDALGYEVNLVEKESGIFSRASLNQEGKIHTGMVYALDDSLATGQKMIKDALMFAPIMEELTGHPIDWQSIRSTPFLYAVHRDSLCSAHRLEKRYRQFQGLYRHFLGKTGSHYLGEDSASYFERVDLPEGINPTFFQACFRTLERAIDPESVRILIKSVLAARPDIRTLVGCEVIGIQRDEAGFKTICKCNHGTHILASEIVINSSWEGKKKIDGFLGIKNKDSWHVRLKLGFKARLKDADGVPSLTIVQGPFGDFVNFPQLKYCYLSWYPDCKLGSTNEFAIPEAWEDVLNGTSDVTDIERIKRQTLDAFADLVPGINPEIFGVKAGTVVAYGGSDIDDVNSGLHKRTENPVTEYDGYFSMHTSKFTSAPNNARKLAILLRSKY